MVALAELIAAHVNQWDTASVEQGVFGTADPLAVAGQLEAFASAVLGSAVVEGSFYGSSTGCVAGVVLGDGRRVVIKAYQRRWGMAFLSAVRRVQEHLVEAGFPCPCPILGPEPAGLALATVEELVPDQGMRTLATDVEMAASARGLARQVEICRGVSEPALRDHHPLRASSGELYPQPHNPLFDFSLRVDDAGWIDKLAQAAQATRDADRSRSAVVHTDWSARNVRIEAGQVAVAYDWDSLSVVTESLAVGQAAATWRSTGDATDPIAPGRDEILAYLSAYEAAARRSFTSEQRRAALAAALWVLAYTARCEHALEAATGRRVERARARLAKDGPTYLL